VVISGIPFSIIPAAIGRRVIESIQRTLQAGGWFLAYQVRGTVAELAKPVLGAPDTTLELRNIPPVRVFRWRVGAARPAAASLARERQASLRA
jgi:phospholipid N-methyltransferase